MHLSQLLPYLLKPKMSPPTCWLGGGNLILHWSTDWGKWLLWSHLQAQGKAGPEVLSAQGQGHLCCGGTACAVGGAQERPHGGGDPYREGDKMGEIHRMRFERKGRKHGVECAACCPTTELQSKLLGQKTGGRGGGLAACPPLLLSLPQQWGGGWIYNNPLIIRFYTQNSIRNVSFSITRII